MGWVSFLCFYLWEMAGGMGGMGRWDGEGLDGVWFGLVLVNELMGDG